MIVSEEHFHWVGLVLGWGIVLGWGARDVYLLKKNWRHGRRAHDQIFGSIMGLVIVTIGAIGLITYQLGW